jgi:hypothetical protein
MQVNVAFNSIGFTTALIVNRLRNERLKTDITEQENAADDAQKRDEEDARAKLAFVKRRLADLAAFEEVASGDRSGRKRR